ncbi:peroxiredoxin [Falsihalocynthiibacter sp. BN13B15]|uniref:peroxiredoxin n=1 Tax=Falsihalocynthiibacter sp. BN13B15 TaxID=3240871 RepID=UPI0035103455
MQNSPLAMTNAPDFTKPFVSATQQGEVTLSELRPSPVVLFFYPRDSTAGCTIEAIDFTSLLPQFAAAGAQVFGVSADSLKKHENFISKQSLSVPLICDEDTQMCQDYGVWREKSMYGKVFWGIERSTFLISGTGKILREWRKVKVPDHAQEVLDAVLTEVNG